MWILKKIFSSTRNALNGLREAFRVDTSIRLEVVLGGIIYTVLIVFLWPLTGSQIVLLIASYLLIIITELINTSIEVLLERLHPIRHHIIGVGKDIAAASVFIAFLIAGLVILLLIFNKFGILAW